MTDRQLNFYKRISTLSRSNQVTPEEKKYLVIATNELDKGSDFKKTIITLCRALKALDKGMLQENGLTIGAKLLFEDLKSTYGEPQSTDIYAEKLSSVQKGRESYQKSSIWISLILGVIIILYYIFAK
ncbi:hypothetical protein LL14B4_01260 [Lactococcus lactis subsp. lactis]|uniref:Uncharacterized protein n=1 Tax=Lactococcus lactis subsp. lactis TaxID=1360 RepID=A0A2Z3KLH5_LACLL|nr:hypothetical protein [Lactococcus lactis]AWN64889.1 hypothetical protein LL14B4_01260 [Lactococcus lactis subsp. lactis]